MIADLWDGDPPVTQVWLDHSVPQEPYDSRFPAFAHTHEGMDIGLGIGSSVYATRTGKVGMVALATMQLHFDDGTDMWLFHGDAAIPSGARFALNQVIYHTGNKVPGGGASTGPHLHVEMRPGGVPYNPTNNSLDPVPYLNFAQAAPVPVAVQPGHFTVVAKGDGGTWVHSKPDLSVDSRVDLIDKEAPLDCDGWCHAGAEVAAILDWNTNQPGDDRMFRTSGHHYWIASSMVAGVPANGAPEIPLDAAVPPPNPNPVSPNPPPVVVVPPPVTVPWPTPVPRAADVQTKANGPGVWAFMDKPDFAKLQTDGFQWVALRGMNAEGSNAPVETSQEANWQAWAPEARAAGLRPLLWTYWYGPGEGVTGDVGLYLGSCAKFTADKINSPAFVRPDAVIVDVEDKHLDGLAAALHYLRDATGLAIYLCPPGNPITYGTGARAVPTSATSPALAWDWVEISKYADGIMWQTYTGAWQGSPTIDGVTDSYHGFIEAMMEVALLGSWYNDPAHNFPVCDDTDPARIKDWVRAATEMKLRGTSIWRYGSVSDAALVAFAPGISQPSPGPAPSPAPAPAPVPPVNPAPAPGPASPPAIDPTVFAKLIADLEWFFTEMERIFHIKRPT